MVLANRVLSEPFKETQAVLIVSDSCDLILYEALLCFLCNEYLSMEDVL